MSASKAVCSLQKVGVSFHLTFVQCFAAGSGVRFYFPTTVIPIWSMRIRIRNTGS
jgi:hypothetical protein